MSTDPYPQLLKEAAAEWRNECTAFAQFRQQEEGSQIIIKCRLQATEVMMEFVGEVKFGKDPKGLLFYHKQSDFKVEDADYKVFYHRGPGDLIVVRTDFYVPGETTAFSRFLARVNTSKYPLPRESNVKGSGLWKRFIAATCQTDIHKVTNSRPVRLRFPPIRKQVFFNAEGEANKKHDIDTYGVLLFPDLQNLKNSVENNTVVVDYAPDRIVFHPQGKPDKVVALFLPSEPVKIEGGGLAPPATDWRDFNPSSQKFDTHRGKYAANLNEITEG